MQFLILSRLSGIYSTRRLVQEIQSRGHHARVENPEEVPSDLTAEVLIPRLGHFRYDQSLAALQELQSSGRFQTVLNPLPAFHKSRHKKHAHKILADLPQPELLNEVTSFPVIVKDCLSSQGEGVFLCKNPQELQSCLLKLQGREILFQEFIAESQGRDLRVFVIGNKIAGAMERRSVNPQSEFRSNLSLGGTAAPIELRPEEGPLALEAARRLGLDYAGVDLIRSRRRSLILEVNPCPGLEGIEKWCGQNIAKEIILYAESVHRSHSQR